MLIDTHTHLYDAQFDTDRVEQIGLCVKNNVSLMYMPNCNNDTIAPMLQIEATHPQHCKAMMGLHPCYVKENYKKELHVVYEWFEKRTFCAVGEIGLDYYWDKTFNIEQMDAFEKQIELSIQHQRPIVIHSRESTKDTIATVAKYKSKNVRGVFHCFTGSIETAREIMKLGFYLGIGGVSTYKNAGLKEVLKEIPMSHIVLETDAPYLSPVPYRGKRNESLYLPIIAQNLAQIKNIPLEEVEHITTQNAQNLFL